VPVAAPVYTFRLKSDAGYAALLLTLLGAPVSIGEALGGLMAWEAAGRTILNTRLRLPCLAHRKLFSRCEWTSALRVTGNTAARLSAQRLVSLKQGVGLSLDPIVLRDRR
jgi:hypothetical protein